MRQRHRQPRPQARTLLGLEFLEARTPVSEGVGPLLALSALGHLAPGALRYPPPFNQSTQMARLFDVPTPAASPTALVSLAPQTLKAAVPNPEISQRHEAWRASAPVTASSVGENELVSLDVFATLATPPASPFRQQVAATTDTASQPSMAASAESNVLTSPPDSAPPPIVANPSGSGNAADNLTPALSTALATLVTVSGTAAVPTAVASAQLVDQSLHSGDGGDSGTLPGAHHHHRRGRSATDPLYVLDANHALVIDNGATVHDFASWTVDLYAQVAGATVAGLGYAWDLSQAPDATGPIGQGNYHLHFTWFNFASGSRNDTITITTTNTDGSHEIQSFTFNVIGTSSPGWVANSARPTTTQSWPGIAGPGVITPDAVKSDQETVDAQYYSLGLTTGEVRTSHAFPAYNPGVPAVGLVYNSTAADARPIFIEQYQLNPQQAVPASVSATLTFNNVPTTVAYDTSLLNPGDIMQIALQGDATGLSTGRYNYQIAVTANSTTTLTGQVNVINSANSDFGAGWSLDNLEHIWPVSGGVILEMPGGTSLWFASAGTRFTTPAGDFSTLTQDATTHVYTRTLKDGTKINFNPAGFQTAIVEPTTGNTFAFTYNPRNQLGTITDFDNLTTNFAYSPNAPYKLASITDPAGRVAQFGYDAQNKQLTSITDPDPGYSQTRPMFGYGYDSANRLTTLTDPRQNSTGFQYNAFGRIDTVTRADTTTESVIALQMNGLGTGTGVVPVLAAAAQAVYIDPNSNDWFTSMDWLGFGRATETSDPQGDLAITHRDLNGLAWLSADPRYRRTRTKFDPQGNPLVIDLPDDTTEQYQYNNFSEPTQYIDPNGQTTLFNYGSTTGADSCSCLTGVALPGLPAGPSPLYQMTYNPHGFLQTFTDPNGNVTTYGYDTRDRQTSITYPPDSMGHNPQVILGYNAASDLTSRTDELGHATTYKPDNLGRVLAVTLPLTGNPQNSFTFDAASNQTSVTDTIGNLTQFHFDAMNRVDRTTDPNTNLTTYGYDNAGNLQDLFDRKNQHRHFVYDGANRLTAEQWLTGGGTVFQTESYGYDAASELTSASDPASAYAFTYDARGRLQTADNQGTPGVPRLILTSGYDKNGNRTSLADNVNGGLSYVYDVDNRLISASLAVTGATDHPKVTFTPDPAGRITAISRTVTTGGFQVNTALGYTNRDQVNSIAHTYPGGSVNFAYTYDNARRLKTYTGPNGENLSYTYDNINQLTGVTGSHTENYNYTNPTTGADLNGNRSSDTTHTYQPPAPGNRLTSDGVYNYAYDAEGNLQTKTQIVGGQVTTYTWDYRNRLTRVQISGTSVDVHFTYDALDRRIGKLSGGVQQWTVYDGYNPYADFNGSTMTTRYLYGNGVDDILARTDAAGNNTVWYLKDHLGSVRLIVSATGAVLYSVNYDSFGNILSQAGSGGDRFKFTGREWDAEIGLYYYRARYFDPGTGRFLSEDPLQFGAGDSNLYRYVTNQPIGFTDPIGLIVTPRKPSDAPIGGDLNCRLKEYDRKKKRLNELIKLRWRIQQYTAILNTIAIWLQQNPQNPIAILLLPVIPAVANIWDNAIDQINQEILDLLQQTRNHPIFGPP